MAPTVMKGWSMDGSSSLGHALVEDRAAVADVEDGDHQEAHHTRAPRSGPRMLRAPTPPASASALNKRKT